MRSDTTTSQGEQGANGGRRRRLRIKRQRHNKNSAMRAHATISQGKQKGKVKASVT
jgi:hypothetical protein